MLHQNILLLHESEREAHKLHPGAFREFNIDDAVYYTLQFYHGYNIEKYKIKQALKQTGIPMLDIETDYGDSCIEQIGLRVNSFMEMLS